MKFAQSLRFVQFHSKGSASQKVRSAMGGLGRIISKPDNTRLNVGVGIGGAFSVSLYQYSDDNRPVRVRAFSRGWTSEAEWRYHYTAGGELDKITAGSLRPVWMRL